MKQHKLDTLLILRGLLAVSVLIWHIRSSINNHLSIFDIPGRTAVWFFFGISGYVISYGFFTNRYPYTYEGIKSFYINRFLRIYPLFILISFLTLLTEYFISGRMLIRLSDIPSQLFMLQFNHEYVLNGVFWTLGIEVQFYLIVPLLAIVFMKKNTNNIFVYFALYALLVLWVPFTYYFFGWSFDGRNLLSHLSHFLVGMIACKLLFEKKLPRIHNYVLIGSILSLILVTNNFYHHSIKYYWTIGSVLIDVCIFLAVVLHANLEQKTMQQPGLFFNGFTILGTISYGVYAWHPYVLAYVPFVDNQILFAVIATIIVAYISYRFVEKPILKLKR